MLHIHIKNKKNEKWNPILFIALEYLRINIIFCPKLFRFSMSLYNTKASMREDSICSVRWCYDWISLVINVPQFKQKIHEMNKKKEIRTILLRWHSSRNISSCRVVHTITWQPKHSCSLAGVKDTSTDTKPKKPLNRATRLYIYIIPKYQTYNS